MSLKLLTEQCLEILSLLGGCTGLSEATLVKIPYCWKSRVTALFSITHSSLEACQKTKLLIWLLPIRITTSFVF